MVGRTPGRTARSAPVGAPTRIVPTLRTSEPRHYLKIRSVESPDVYVNERRPTPSLGSNRPSGLSAEQPSAERIDLELRQTVAHSPGVGFGDHGGVQRTNKTDNTASGPTTAGPISDRWMANRATARPRRISAQRPPRPSVSSRWGRHLHRPERGIWSLAQLRRHPSRSPGRRALRANIRTGRGADLLVDGKELRPCARWDSGR